MNRSLIAGAGLVAIVALLGGTWFATRHGADDVFAACRASAVAGGREQIGGPFTLVSETGATVTDAQVIDRPTLVYFGYSSCPDVCPMDLARNVSATQLLTEQGHDVKPVFISVDPQRDTPAQLTDYTDFYDPKLLGLTGAPEQIRKAATEYRVYYKIHAPEDPSVPDYYPVDHSAFTYLMLPGHGFVDFYRRDLPPEAMAKSVACYLDKLS